MTKLHDLLQQGQSIWLDYSRRRFIDDGGLQDAIERGVRGVTSNPSIFEKAIAGSSDYDEAVKTLVNAGKSSEEIYEALVIDDMQKAADLLRPVYEESQGLDGYVSLEMNPKRATNTQRMIAEARRLFNALDRPNVMIKVPATAAGIPAIAALIGDGININVTLMFSMQHYEDVANAYITGLEKLAERGGDVSSIASVASLFISRVECAADKALGERGITDIQGSIAVANAKVLYQRFKEILNSERWQALAEQGVRNQRPLWASTGTNNPLYSPTKYVDELIGPDTVNTLPPHTLEAFLNQGTVARTLDSDLSESIMVLEQLADSRISLADLAQQLQDAGVESFAQAFDTLMASIQEKRDKIAAGWHHLETELGDYEGAVQGALQGLREENITQRIWAHDHTVWSDSPTEITNRLGWLHIMEAMQAQAGRIQHLAKVVKADGYTHVLVLGMGGSTLAPEVFSKTFYDAQDRLWLEILDSTDPGAVLAYDAQLPISRTLFIVSTKSGGTAETLSFFKYFYNRALDELGSRAAAGRHFVAITDPGSKLEVLADRYQFRATFLNDPNIGGRYSVLSYFGLIPAVLAGVDIDLLLERAARMAANCDAYNCPSQGDNNGGRLGAVMGELAKAGRDKVTIIASPAISHFGDWAEQLIAESTGKSGKGILPVVGEAIGKPADYGDDRLFVYMRLDDTYDARMEALKTAGHPVVTLHLQDRYDLGGQFFLWEMATAVAGQRIGINPFDQPNVEAAKKLARAKIADYQETGKLEALEAALETDGIKVIGAVQADSPGAALNAFLNQAAAGAYISLHAYLQPTDETTEALQALQTRLRDTTKLATTLGYGPRFLHSTGQLHKGDAGKGLFIQFTADMPRDAAIPDEAGEPESSMTFGTLKEAQALGDRQALLDAKRQVIRFHLADPLAGIRALTAAL